MLNKYARASIIALTKYIMPVVLILLLIPQWIHLGPQLTQANQFFHLHRAAFLCAHGLFYPALYCFWPRFISLLIKRSQHHVTQEQYHVALNAKWYLLAALFFFEILACMR